MLNKNPPDDNPLPSETLSLGEETHSHAASQAESLPLAPYLYILYLVLNPCRLRSTKSVYSCERWKGPLSYRSQSKGLVACWSETAATANTQQCRLRAIHSHRAIRETTSAPAPLRHTMLPLGTWRLHPLSLPSTPRRNT